MKTEANEPINPCQVMGSDGNVKGVDGLTKREYFAAMAMQGTLVGIDEKQNFKIIAEWSVQQADALIEALNK